MIHYFSYDSIKGLELPELFTYPFCYTPHPLSIKAAEILKEYLANKPEWNLELQKGKMFGVLVVLTPHNELGFLAAFSGILAGRYIHKYFVPPIYNLQASSGFFKPEEEIISSINKQIIELEASADYQKCLKRMKEIEVEASNALREAKEANIKAKKERDERRKIIGNDSIEHLELIKDSQYRKAEYKRLEKWWKIQIEKQRNELDWYLKRITELKVKRKERSSALQSLLFKQFKILNSKGEERNLYDIFSSTPSKIPPAGAGECAAPKLLQYAYQHHLKPICMAEFWWGNSPLSEIRRHGYYYPSCKQKCEPILNFMLQGLHIEPNPLLKKTSSPISIPTIYEDEYLLVINKPYGMLSVPGKENIHSVFQYIKDNYPQFTGPLIVHRLDMDTSGLLIIAKNKEAHTLLQSLFESRMIKKRYVALLDGKLSDEIPPKGFIRLSLRPDYTNRPYQLVDDKDGKPAITRYEVLGTEQIITDDSTHIVTRIAYYPITGRTHQLRVHSAHSLGMNLPILGDKLYGKASKRLYLHSESLEFQHPITKKRLKIVSSAQFI